MGDTKNNNTFGIGLGQIGGAAAGGIMGAIGANSQHRRQKELMDKQFNNQSRLNQQGHQMQKDMWEFTNYPNQVKMMLEAGLSPAMMYGGTGAGGATTGGQGGGSAAGGSATAMDVGAMVNMAKQGAEIDYIKAQTELTENKARTEEQNKLLAMANTDLANASIDNIKQEYKNLVKEGKRRGLENDFLDKTLKDRVASVGIENLFKKQGITESKAKINNMVDTIKELRVSNDIKAFEAKLKAEYPSLHQVAGGQWNKVVNKIYELYERVDSIREVEKEMRE